MKLNFRGDNPFEKIKVSCLVFWAFAIIFFLGIILFAVLSRETSAYPEAANLDPNAELILIISWYSLLSLWALERFWSLKINIWQIIGKKPTKIKWLSIVGLVISLLLFSFGAFYLTYYPLSLIAPNFVESVLNNLATSYSPAKTSAPLLYHLLLFATLVIFAPIFEEFLFRGFIFHRWATKYGIRPAIIASSLFFGICHLNFLGISVLGVVLTILYLRSRTLIVPIIAHAINNAIAFTFILLPTENNLNSDVGMSTMEQFHSQGWIGMICLSLSLPFLWRFFRKNWSKKYDDLPYFANQSDE